MLLCVCVCVRRGVTRDVGRRYEREMVMRTAKVEAALKRKAAEDSGKNGSFRCVDCDIVTVCLCVEQEAAELKARAARQEAEMLMKQQREAALLEAKAKVCFFCVFQCFIVFN